MFKLSSLETDNFFKTLQSLCVTHFPGEPKLEHQIKSLALLSFSNMSKSDSLLFSLDYTIKCATIALDVVRGQIIQSGHADAQSLRQILCATLFSRVGILRGLFSEDNDPTFLISDGQMLTLPFTQTDSALWQHCADRSCTYIRSKLSDVPHLDIELLAEAIQCADFTKTMPVENCNPLCGITRACQVIGLMSNLDPNRATLKIFFSAREGGILDRFGLKTLDQFRAGYQQYFWENLFADITDIIPILGETDRGFERMMEIYQQSKSK
jgi:hypothetical protein